MLGTLVLDGSPGFATTGLCAIDWSEEKLKACVPPCRHQSLFQRLNQWFLPLWGTEVMGPVAVTLVNPSPPGGFPAGELCHWSSTAHDLALTTGRMFLPGYGPVCQQESLCKSRPMEDILSCCSADPSDLDDQEPLERLET